MYEEIAIIVSQRLANISISVRKLVDNSIELVLFLSDLVSLINR